MSDHLDPSPDETLSQDSNEQLRPVVTRREFMAGAGAGLAVGAVVAGGIAVATRPAAQTAPSTTVATGPGGPVVTAPGAAPSAPGTAANQPTTANSPATSAPAALPLSQRRVELHIDGATHPVTVDVRESLWETMVFTLGLSSSNLGCDRAQCGACTVLIDGRAVNSCTMLSARLGRGQQIVTVDGIRTGPGIEGLHPIQKAFWQVGGYQCGICTRGFIMSTYALLQVNKSPTNEEIVEALSGNICRCSEYPQIMDSVHAAAAELRGEQVISISGGADASGGSLEDPSLAE